jgi:hypothetical protein
MSLDEIKTYLPKYLSAESEARLFADLNQFPENIDNRLYTSHLKDEEVIFQGDGLEGFLVVNLPDTTINKAPVMVLSNTCDIGPDKKSMLGANIVYTPIFNFDKYISLLKTKKPQEQEFIEKHIEAIKRQEITSIFYLPKGASLSSDSLVFLDKVNNCNSDYVAANKVKNMRLFTLSDYGFYLFLFKLSIHFTRVRERIDRKSN